MTAKIHDHANNSPCKLRSALEQRILVIDGAMGSMIQTYDLQEADYRGKRFADYHRDLKGNNDLLNITNPTVIDQIHRAYLDAGTDILETNTFNGTRVAQGDYGLEDTAREINVAGAKLARLAADEYTLKDPTKPRFVAGVLGPTPRTNTKTGLVICAFPCGILSTCHCRQGG